MSSTASESVSPAGPTASVHCDPCEWPIIDTKTSKRRKCGWVGKAIRSHLKAHRDSRNNVTTFEQYVKRFPNRNYGEKPYSPSADEIARFREANPNHKDGSEDTSRVPAVKADRTARRAEEKSVEARVTELWNMVMRDPAAQIFCEQTAEEEHYLKGRRALYKEASDDPQHAQHKTRSSIAKDIGDTIERLEKLYRSLNITVEQRRKNNTIGTDTVCQIIAGFAKARRNLSPEVRAAQDERVLILRHTIGDRIRVNLLDEVQDALHEERKDVTNPADLDAAIRQFGKNNGIR